jgi:hypothetical protein
MRRSYVIPMRWMVIYEYEVPGGALNLSSTKLPRPWSPWESASSRTAKLVLSGDVIPLLLGIRWCKYCVRHVLCIRVKG